MSPSDNSNNFWAILGQFFEEMAPIAGPLCQTLGQTSDVIHRVSNSAPRLQDASADAYLPEGE